MKLAIEGAGDVERLRLTGDVEEEFAGEEFRWMTVVVAMDVRCKRRDEGLDAEDTGIIGIVVSARFDCFG